MKGQVWKPRPSPKPYEVTTDLHARLGRVGGTAAGAGEVVGGLVGQRRGGAVVEVNAVEALQQGCQGRAGGDDVADGLEQGGAAEVGGAALVEALVQGLARDAKGPGQVLQRGAAALEEAKGQGAEEVGGAIAAAPLVELCLFGQLIGSSGEQGLQERRQRCYITHRWLPVLR